MGKKKQLAAAPAWDKPLKKPRADSKLKLRPEQDQETWWLLLHPTDPDSTPPYTVEQLLVHILDAHGIEVALSTLSEWVAWYGLKQRTERAQERVEQARLKMAQDPNFTAKDLNRMSRTIFMAEMLQKGDVNGYRGLAALEIEEEKVRQAERKLEQSDRALQIDERRLKLLEDKAAKLDAAQAAINAIKDDKTLTPEAQREAVLSKMDEFFGLKKATK